MKVKIFFLFLTLNISSLHGIDNSKLIQIPVPMGNSEIGLKLWRTPLSPLRHFLTYIQCVGSTLKWDFYPNRYVTKELKRYLSDQNVVSLWRYRRFAKKLKPALLEYSVLCLLSIVVTAISAKKIAGLYSKYSKTTEETEQPSPAQSSDNTQFIKTALSGSLYVGGVLGGIASTIASGLVIDNLYRIIITT
jgi:hypothetical protein